MASESETMREAFEAWARTQFHGHVSFRRYKNGEYIDPDVMHAWAGYVAGRRAPSAEAKDALLIAARNYKLEFDNPAPDYILRHQRRSELFAAIAQQPKDGQGVGRG